MRMPSKSILYENFTVGTHQFLHIMKIRLHTCISVLTLRSSLLLEKLTGQFSVYGTGLGVAISAKKKKRVRRVGVVKGARQAGSSEWS